MLKWVTERVRTAPKPSCDPAPTCRDIPVGSTWSEVVKGTGFGLVADIAIGIVGALIGSWLLPRLGHPPWLRHCPCHHRRDHRRDHSVAHSQTALQAREVVTA
jgi:hypothetical protein